MSPGSPPSLSPHPTSGAAPPRPPSTRRWGAEDGSAASGGGGVASLRPTVRDQEEPAVASIDVTVTSPLPPDEVLRVLTDFGPGRAEAWPGVSPDRLTVHASGADYADVTEGNDVGWERERYSWDAAAGTVSAVTSESNLWAAGSRW